jgi:phosphoglycerate dehydrogenase-like enzyme
MNAGDTFRIAVLDDYQGVAHTSADWQELPLGCEVAVARRPLRGQALVDFLAGARAVVAMRERTPVDQSLLDALPDLKLIVTIGMVNAAIDLDAARERGIPVCGTRSLAGPATELTWALIMACLRRLPEEVAAMAAGGWQTTIGTELEGKTLGIIGLGHIGRRIARIARVFDMDVVAWSQHLTAESAAMVGARRVGKEELFSGSDVVTVHLKLSERTRHLVTAQDLALMRPHAYLVNTSRRPIVDEIALLHAVREGRIAGAALDVYDEEPLPEDHPFRNTPGILATGHVGYVTDGNYRIYYRDTVENIGAFLAGEPIRRIN